MSKTLEIDAAIVFSYAWVEPGRCSGIVGQLKIDCEHMPDELREQVEDFVRGAIIAREGKEHGP